MLDFEAKRTKDTQFFKRMLQYLKPYRKPFIISLLLLIIVVVIDLLPAILIGKLMEAISVNNTAEKSAKMLLLFVYLGSFVLSLALRMFIDYRQSMILQEIGEKIVLQIRKEVFEHIEGLSANQLNQVPVGKMVTRVMNDPDAISQMFTSILINLIKSFLMMIVILILLFVINVKLALLTIAIVPLVAITSFIFRKVSRKTYQKVRDEISALNAFLSENLSGMKITQLFNQEDKKRAEFRHRSRELEKSFQKEILIYAVFRPMIYIITMIGLVGILYFGGIEVIKGLLTYGILYTTYLLVEKFFDPIQQIAEEFNNMQNAFAGAEKIFNVLDTKPDIVDSEDAIELDELKGYIEFKNVWFAYNENEWILKDVSFTVEPGETVAFVGATGAGKTTILGLIVRNYDIQKGQILIDGMDIKKIKISSLRKNIGQMLQDVFLFNKTIEENITLNNPDIHINEVIEASKYVGAHTFIRQLPDQYSHMVLERGNNFSSGQRQLISFARAIVYQPSILILDEATANIDSETEQIIQESLKKIMKTSTMLIVAHRLSTIQHSDKIIVLHKGEIMEMGNHQELLKRKGLYYNLYRLQFESNIKEKLDLLEAVTA